MYERNDILMQAESIAREAKREEIDQLVSECEHSEHVVLRSLAGAYRRFKFGS